MAQIISDDYITDTVEKGDLCSNILAELTLPTIQNGNFSMIGKPGMNQVAVLNPLQEGEVYIATTSAGDPSKRLFSEYVDSFLHDSERSAEIIKMDPVALTNIIDASKADPWIAVLAGSKMKDWALNNGIGIPNGEYADLSVIVNSSIHANISGTLIGKKKISEIPEEILEKGIGGYLGVNYFIIDPKGDFVYTNCDGVGTKHKLYAMRADLEKKVWDPTIGVNVTPHALANWDDLAMNLDDTAKIAASAKLVLGVLEHNGKGPINEVMTHFIQAAHYLRVEGMLTGENISGRINPYKKSWPAFNISTTTISTVNEHRLNNLPKPKAGEKLYLVFKNPNSIKGGANPRSNGISSVWGIPENEHGKDWYKTEQEILTYGSRPSTVFYNFFINALTSRAASAVFHNSGGAFNGKLAKPLAKHGLHAELYDLNGVPESVRKLIELDRKNNPDKNEAVFYGKWPMNNEAFVASSDENKLRETANGFGYIVREVATLRKSDKPGISLTTYKGTEVYMDGEKIHLIDKVK